MITLKRLNEIRNSASSIRHVSTETSRIQKLEAIKNRKAQMRAVAQQHREFKNASAEKGESTFNRMTK